MLVSIAMSCTTQRKSVDRPAPARSPSLANPVPGNSPPYLVRGGGAIPIYNGLPPVAQQPVIPVQRGDIPYSGPVGYPTPALPGSGPPQNLPRNSPITRPPPQDPPESQPTAILPPPMPPSNLPPQPIPTGIMPLPPTPLGEQTPIALGSDFEVMDAQGLRATFSSKFTTPIALVLVVDAGAAASIAVGRFVMGQGSLGGWPKGHCTLLVLVNGGLADWARFVGQNAVANSFNFAGGGDLTTALQLQNATFPLGAVLQRVANGAIEKLFDSGSNAVTPAFIAKVQEICGN
jgi:hypothetical protein